MATRRLCKVNPDDLKQSWDRRACKGGASSASFQLFKLETGTRAGLFSLPHPPHPLSVNPADTACKTHLDLFSPLFPRKPTTAAKLCCCVTWRSRDLLPEQAIPLSKPSLQSPPGSPFKLQIRLRTACLNLQRLPIKRGTKSQPSLVSYEVSCALTRLHSRPHLFLRAWQGHLSVCLKVLGAGTVPARGGSPSGFADFTAPCSAQPFI
ncbi:unnamed protein product [Rangifer tarandus platyrhynchus]|uniref:Uncharacterized protein n=1 Tax=Rangifer tarandus platyrhynchus TaxID=3082113 RepID=A0AC60A694_RANTA